MTYTENIFKNTKEFFAMSAEFLYANEEANSLLIGLLESKPDAWVANIRANGDTVLVAGYLGLTPKNLIIAGSHVGAVDHLVDLLEQHKIDAEGAVGNKQVVAKLGAQLCARTNREAVLRFRQLIYRCSEVRIPKGIEGNSRLAEECDFEKLVKWRRDFRIEALPHELPDQAQLEREANDAIIKKDTYMWIVNGEAVSCAQVGRPTARTMTVRYVFTPKEHRRKGYASAISAVATDNILKSGKKYGVLFTDAANPTSNHIYQELGYEYVTESMYLGFV